MFGFASIWESLPRLKIIKIHQDMITWIKQIKTWPKTVASALSVALVGLIGVGDYLTGYEAIFFIFYLIPVVLATWCIGVLWGVFISILSVIVWHFSNFEAGAHYISSVIPVWNAAMIFVLYLIVIGLLKMYEEVDQRVQQRTLALTREMQQRRRLEKELLETTEREQRRIGHDLHDNLGQHLTATALAGQLLGQKLSKKSFAEAAAANHIVQLVEEAIDLTRTLARSLHPVEMQAEGILDGLSELAATSSDQFKIICQFEFHSGIALSNLDATANIHLYRIAQESVRNAVKHGKAKHILIRFEMESGDLALTITDDGAGLSENQGENQGMGLRIMAYRASMIGASFRIERLACGARVICKLPANTAAF
jgi:signal transduction histidine kinase